MDCLNILFTYRGSFLYDIPRSIFAGLDGAVYWFLARVYNLITDLARVDIFSDTTLNDFYTKIYSLLTIFMLFKLTFSIFSYILDPNKISDKQQGVGNIIKNILIMFIMLLSAPVAFKLLKDTQNAILDDNIIFDFIFIKEGEDQYTEENSLTVGDVESCKTWMSTESKYKNLYDRMSDYDKVGVDEDDFIFRDKNYAIGQWIAESEGDYIALSIYRTFFNLDVPTSGQLKYLENYKNSKEKNNTYGYLCNNLRDANIYDMTSMMNDYLDRGTKEYYVIDYKWGVATAVGVFTLLIFISICFDVAVRTIKLSFLQLIAPIPIMSYIDPNSGKSGVFSKWLKEVGRTWASLFIKLLSVFFAIYIIKSLDTDFALNSISMNGHEQQSSDFFIKLMIILGALMFAKQLPQLIEELLPGIKMGKMQLNPLKKIEEEAIGGKQIAGAVRGVGGAARGLVGGSIAGRKAGMEAGSPVKGLLLGAGQGLVGGFKTPKGAFSNSMKETYKTLTGNELARFSLSKMIAQAGSDKKMNEVKDTLKSLNEEKRNLSQKLSVQEHTTGAVASSLQANGIDLSDLSNEKNKLQTSKNIKQSSLLRNQNLKNTELANIAGFENDKRRHEADKAKYEALRDSEQARYEQAQKVANEADEFIKNNRGSMSVSEYFSKKKVLDDFAAEEAKFKTNISQYDADIKNTQQKIINVEANIDKCQKNVDQYDAIMTSLNNDIAQIDNNIKNIDVYEKSYNETVNTRADLAKVEKDITTMQNEKTQRAKFNQVEEKSPKEDVDKIISKYNNKNNNTP